MPFEYYYDRLREIKVIDTHEHLWDENWRLANPGDWSSLFFHYGNTALKVAGMSSQEEMKFYSCETPHSAKWEIFSKYYPLVRNIAYIKSVLTAIKDIYGINSIDSGSMEELSSKISAAVKPGFNRRILQQLGGMDYCMVNSFDCDENGQRYPVRNWGDTELLRPDLFADGFIYPSLHKLLEKETGIACDTLGGWLKATDLYFETYAHLCCSIKIALGYRGSLDFSPDVSLKTAEKYFNSHYTGETVDYQSVRPLVDYMFFHIIKKAAEYRLPLKFHTGLYAGCNEVDLAAQEGNVMHLARLAAAHPECRFIAMHIAYPFQDQLVMAVKQIVNLYADMSWAWVVDTQAAADFVRKVLCAAPVVKVTGFGGDYSLAENAYGHLELARRAIARVLDDMESSGYFDRDEAAEAGRFLLRESAVLLYRKSGL